MQKYSNGYHYAAVSAWTEASDEGAGCEIWHERDTGEVALNRLINEQVVESFPRQEIRVRSISEEDAKETFSIRLMMDLFFVREIIESVSMNQQLREALQNNVDVHYRAVQSAQDHTDAELFLLNYKYDYEFHELYLKCSGNKKSWRFIGIPICFSIPIIFSKTVGRERSGLGQRASRNFAGDFEQG